MFLKKKNLRCKIEILDIVKDWWFSVLFVEFLFILCWLSFFFLNIVLFKINIYMYIYLEVFLNYDKLRFYIEEND